MSLTVLGSMTGTSCDGLDFACVRFQGDSFRLLWTEHFPYPRRLRQAVLQLQKQPSATPPLLENVLALDQALGEWYADCVETACRSSQREQPEVVAQHGQTVLHQPARGWTVQLGNPWKVAAHTGLTVVSDFRRGDVAAGGEGAPLVPLFHQIWYQAFFRSLKKPLPRWGLVQNLGGIGNVTVLGFPPGRKPTLQAFDTGPGNLWMDAATQEVTEGRRLFDREGQLASQGMADEWAVRTLLKTHPFFKKPPPKSTGREEWPYSLFRSHTPSVQGPSLVATATELTLRSLEGVYRAWRREEGGEHLREPIPLFLCGGGALNTFFVSSLKERLAPFQVEVMAEAQWMEAMAFAYLGYRSLLGKSLGGAWTGKKAGAWAAGGAIVPGRNWKKCLEKIQRSLERGTLR